MNLTGEVITTPFTYASTTQAIVRNGLTPVFCDINQDDYTMDVLEKRYVHYKDEGGNSYAAHLMADLRELPKNPPEEEE